MEERYVVLGVGRPRAQWFGDVASWAHSATLPLDFLKCVSVDELRARMTAVPASAVLVDAGVPGVDRSLLAAAATAGLAAVVVAGPTPDRDWSALGASAVLPTRFDADALIRTLHAVAEPVSSVALDVADEVTPAPADRHVTGRLVAVCGRAGSGVSSVAMAAAQGLARRPANRGAVVMVDLALDADLALYHHAPDGVATVGELVEAHRIGAPDAEAVDAMLCEVERRGYHLLAGLRHHRGWTSLPPVAVDAALASLRTRSRWVVCDVEGDLEGEAETGSIDVEERNGMARGATGSASVVLAVGDPGLAGLRGLVRQVRDLIRLGVEPSRIVPVVNRAPTRRPPRAEIRRALAASGLDVGCRPVVFVRHHRDLETRHANVDPFPAAMADALATAIEAATLDAGVGAHESPVRTSPEVAVANATRDV